MASLEHDTLADLATTVAEVRNEEQTAETKEAGGSVATDGVNSGCDKPVVPSLGPTGPALSQTPATTGVANGAAASAHPKKFSAVNINKKFLEKTGSSTPSAPPTGHAVAKSGNSSPKPALQTNASHSRLVTTKLTAGLTGLSSSGPGWSRPSSTTPLNPTPTAEPTSATATSTAASAAPQLSVAGKVIQPQLRVATSNSPSQPSSQGGAAKPVWRTQKVVASPVADPKAQSDFPTAAEATQVRPSQPPAQKEATGGDSAKKQALQQQDDAFRGVHLDPNAHHWDEMEGDDDAFLDGVIEFGDGKQYKIQPAHATAGDPERCDSQTEAEPPVSKDNRFADDFDRSWPRSATTPNLPNQRDLPPHTSAAPSGRTLFNERSNRMEHVQPGLGSHRESPPHLGTRRDSRSSPVEHRISNDGSVHTPQQGFHLLQKQPHHSDTPPFRSRGSRPGGFHDGELRHDGPPLTSPRMPLSAGSQSSFSSKDTLPPSMGRIPSTPGRNRDAGPDLRPRRMSNMGPPPVPVDRSQDADRQLPPHLSQGPPAINRAPSSGPARRDSNVPRETRPSIVPPSPRTLPSQSPLLSPKVLASAPEYEEVSKAAMHTAAEQARLRRQQEEEEREKAKERARRKAAELEAKLKPPPAQADSIRSDGTHVAINEEAVLNVITDAVKTVSSPSAGSAQPSDTKSDLRRSPSVRGSARPPTLASLPKPALSADPSAPRKSTLGTASPGLDSPSPAQEASSWRRPSVSQIPSSAHQSQPSPAILPATSPKAHIAPAVEPIVLKPDDVLEEVDFADMGSFVGASEGSATKPPMSPRVSHPSGPLRAGRPVASDFFEDTPGNQQSAPIPKSESASWRRKAPEVSPSAPRALTQPIPAADMTATEPPKLRVSPSLNRDASLSPRAALNHDLPPRPSTFGHTSPTLMSRQPSHHGVPRSPRTGAFREPSMTALDDAMSRIKGALDGMQAHDVVASSSRTPATPAREPSTAAEAHKVVAVVSPPAKNVGLPKWLPPALRPRTGAAPTEDFESTCSELPHSPKPVWNTFTVWLPRQFTPLEPLSKKQANAFKAAAQVRWDILSWVPPVEGMTRKDLSVNDVLFKKPPMVRGTPKYVVVLPSSVRPIQPAAKGAPAFSTVKVNLPATQGSAKPTLAGAFARPREADGTDTWRKPTSKVDGLTLAPVGDGDAALNTVSRSPPPAPPSGEGNPSVSGASTRPSDAVKEAPTSPEHKIVASTSVAFPRDSAGGQTALNTISFTVVSELEGPTSISSSQQPALVARKPNAPGRSPAPHLSGLPPAMSVAYASVPKDANSVAESKSKASGPINRADTNQPPANPAKALVVRGPDPEHLKAVWSQTSDKTDLPASNSLEGIADDLSALQRFTLQDVKSDGGTPPLPPPVSQMRMSLSEVTKAFQQVPTSSSNSTEHAPPSPPSTSVGATQPTRRPSYGPSSGPNSTMRPMYAQYPGPMLSSPSPTLVYPQMASSPGPRPMQLPGPPQQYGQPMWIPVGPGTGPSTPAGMVRTLSSPYGAPIMAYSPSGHPPTMYPPGTPHGYMPPGHMQQAGPPPGQVRAMPMMSPMTSHAAMPMYAGSPVLVHAQPYPSAMTPGQPPRPLPPGAVTPRSGPPPLPYGQVPQSPYHRPW